MPDVTRFLHALRQHFGTKNDKKLADAIGVSTGKLSEWKTGKLGVTLKAIRKISEKTAISQRELLDWLEPAADQKQGITKPPIRLVPKRRRANG